MLLLVCACGLLHAASNAYPNVTLLVNNNDVSGQVDNPKFPSVVFLGAGEWCYM